MSLLFRDRCSRWPCHTYTFEGSATLKKGINDLSGPQEVYFTRGDRLDPLWGLKRVRPRQKFCHGFIPERCDIFLTATLWFFIFCFWRTVHIQNDNCLNFVSTAVNQWEGVGGLIKSQLLLWGCCVSECQFCHYSPPFEMVMGKHPGGLRFF